MEEIVGSTNRILEIDLSANETKEFQISPEERRQYIGGKGLALFYLSRRLPVNIDPLSAENPLIIMLGALLGTGAPCSSRFCAVTKSPLTEIIVASSCGGPFGLALKTAGYEGLILRGKAASPTTIVIDNTGVRFEDASALWGSTTHQTETLLGLKANESALVIGPAGENLVHYANIMSGGRFLGRGGLGAVMGSKNVKAVVARGGKYKIVTTDPQRFAQLVKKGNRQINHNLFTKTLYRKFGTAANVKLCNDGNILPVYNFRAGQHPRASDVSGEVQSVLFNYKPAPCRSCTIICGHKGDYEGATRKATEYETVSLMGANLGIFDPKKISDWNDQCGELGMDTITTGGTLAYVMEAAEKGLYTSPLRFGNPDGISETLNKIAYRQDGGDELANGSRWLAEKYGGMEFAIQVKGMEMSGYDPRGSWGQGLSYAVANRGACHLSATTFMLEVFLGFLDPHSIKAKAQFVHFFENLYCAVNSMQICLFTGFAYLLEPPLIKFTPKPLLAFMMRNFPKLATSLVNCSAYSRLITLATGVKFSQRALLACGERIHLFERYLNGREGISRKDDTLPERFLSEGRLTDPQNRVVPLDQMLDSYYKIRGYSPEGMPTVKTLKKHQVKPEPETVIP